MKRLRTFLSPPWVHFSPIPASKHAVVVTDSSDVIDGDPGWRFSSPFCWKIGVNRRSRLIAAGIFTKSSDRLRLTPEETLLLDRVLGNRKFGFGSRILQMASVPASSASDASSDATGGAFIPVSSGKGLSVPPRRTVSTAAWHTCQFPVQRSPTAPFTGLTVLPHASNSKDWNRAEKEQSK